MNSISNETKYVQAKVVVNATGPWVDNFLKNHSKQTKVDNVRLVKGSHIVVKKLFNHSYAYIFQNSDGRIFFAVPWENEFTFIGTTDVDFKDDLDSFSVSDDEINYLCKSANQYFRSGISSNDVIKHWSGVRPLYHDGSIKAQKASRDYTIRIDSQDNNSALINIFGGKMTTFRQLAEEVVNKVGSTKTIPPSLRSKRSTNRSIPRANPTRRSSNTSIRSSAPFVRRAAGNRFSTAISAGK